MSALTLTLKAALTQRVDLSALTPDNLVGKSMAEIAAIELPSGKTKPRVDALFDISGENAAEIVIKNSSAKLDYIGNGMKTGSITIHGNVGSYLGFKMRNGGKILLHGNAGDFCACHMAGGMLRIFGNAGDFLGGALPGERKGMKGGTVLVSGNVGERAGDQMRRGLVLIEGNAGNYCASRMIAGTIGVLGSVGEYTGYAMRRGTLLLFSQPKLHPTLVDCGSHTLPFLSLMFKSFKGLPSKFANLDKTRVQRYCGDIANDGRGEILVLK